MKIYFLRKHRSISNYEHPGSYDESLLRAATSTQELRDWWNEHQYQMCLEYAFDHISYHKYIPPVFWEGDELTLPYQSGGGCGVSSYLTIEVQSD